MSLVRGVANGLVFDFLNLDITEEKMLKLHNDFRLQNLTIDLESMNDI